MANVTELDQFDANVYLIATTDDVIGGDTGISNIQPKQLANRTRYLMNRLQEGGFHLADTGSAANVYSAALPITLAALVDGMELKLRAAHANSGASTFTPNATGIPEKPIYGADYAALTGGEIIVDGELTLRWHASLNAGAGAWVLISTAGGTQHAATPSVGNAGTEVATMAALFAAADGLASVSVASGADVTVTKAQYGRAILSITGTPTADIGLILPAQTGQWIIYNGQGGTKNVTAKTAAGTGVVLPQGLAALVYCDGTNVGFAGSAGQAAMRQISITGVSGSTLTVTGGYTSGNILVEKNGGLLEPGDYTATDGTTITLVTAAVSSDKFTVYAFGSFTVSSAVAKAGDTMTGALTLSGNPTNALHAAPKQYVDTAITAAVPSGSVFMFAANAAPSGYLECDGSARSRTTYAALFAVVGTTWGVGDGSTTFNLPDLRGEFVRGWDHGKGTDAGRTFASAQADAFQGHFHTMTTSNTTGGGSAPAAGSGSTNTGVTGGVTAPLTDGTNGTPRTAAETRPRNIAMMYCIKT